jgi:sporulation protein YlmC with PRC-barrel domain
MARYGIGPMILATAILAVPVLAATPNAGTDTSPANANPAASAPAPNAPAGNAMTPNPAGTSHAANAGAPVGGPAGGHAATTSATANSTPKFMTSDNEVRVGKLVGATVYNDKGDSVGSIDDVLMAQDGDKAQTAIISVGGFLGMGSKLVSVPFDKLKIEKDKVVMSGATKDALKGMPEYKYNNA